MLQVALLVSRLRTDSYKVAFAHAQTDTMMTEPKSAKYIEGKTEYI
jgi:hypothetical protein